MRTLPEIAEGEVNPAEFTPASTAKLDVASAEKAAKDLIPELEAQASQIG